MNPIDLKNYFNFSSNGFKGNIFIKAVFVLFFLIQMGLLNSNLALAVSEGDFHNTFQNEVLPHFEQSQEGSFVAQDGVTISYRIFENDNETGALVILPGCGIPAIGYSELMYDIKDLGLSFYVLDHRGQGNSEKLAKDQQTHVGEFDHYVSDLSQFMDTVVNKKLHTKRFLLGESMGCAIGTQYLLKNLNAFSGVILSTPMFGLNTGYCPQYITHRFAEIGCMLGLGEWYAPRNYKYSLRPFSSNHLTQSQTRYEFAQSVIESQPQYRQGGVTYQWVATSLSSIVQIQTSQTVFDFPLMVFRAGKDLVIRNDAIDQFCNVQDNCKLVKFEDSLHGLLMETDAIRDEAVTEIKAFIRNHVEL